MNRVQLTVMCSVFCHLGEGINPHCSHGKGAGP